MIVPEAPLAVRVAVGLVAAGVVADGEPVETIGDIALPETPPTESPLPTLDCEAGLGPKFEAGPLLQAPMNEKARRITKPLAIPSRITFEVTDICETFVKKSEIGIVGVDRFRATKYLFYSLTESIKASSKEVSFFNEMRMSLTMKSKNCLAFTKAT